MSTTEAKRQRLLDDLFRRSSQVYGSSEKAYAAGDLNEMKRLNRLHKAIADEYQEIKKRSSTQPE